MANMSAWVMVTCSAAFLGCALVVLAQRKKTQNRVQPYGLHHGRLNLRLPPESMWMNMGFWGRRGDRKPAIHLPEACLALLQQVFASAGLQQQDSSTTHKISLLDVGFGCGDQILEIFQGVDFSNIHVQKYVGITSSTKQFQFARERLERTGLQNDCTTRHGPSKVDIFGESAAVPKQWSRKLQESVKALPSRDTWLLGLDSLYHLSPSRDPLFAYAHTELGASVMAFDLLLANTYESLPLLTRVLLRFVCLVTAVPYRNLMTEEDYRKTLIATGYSAEAIQLMDISDHVFKPLADFLDAQEYELKAIGMGLGALRPAKAVFRWWADSGIVRGYIVTAKHV